MRTHTGEKPYKCKYCNRAFSQSNDLGNNDNVLRFIFIFVIIIIYFFAIFSVKHTRSHVGDNTYQCKQCSVAFRLHSELREHSKIHYLEQKNRIINKIESTPSTTNAIVLVSENQQDDDNKVLTSTSTSAEPQIIYIKEEMQQQQYTEEISPTTTTIILPASDTETAGSILIQHIQIA